MLASHAYRAEIQPIDGSVKRPLWSVMIPTYNCAAYLRETLATVLIQDPGPDVMQIEVVDDCSTDDDPEAVVNEVGGGRVAFYRHSQHVGHTTNFDTCLQRARGTLVHLLHGDDGVRPGFYRAMGRAFQRNEKIGAAFCRQVFINDEGHWVGISPLEQRESNVLSDYLARLAVEQRIMTPSMVVKREAYEELGGFDSRLVCSEDWEMWVRIASHYPIWYEVEPLALYRMHRHSNTGRHVRSGQDITYTCMAIDIFKHYLPADLGPEVSRSAKETYAKAALRMARTQVTRGDVPAAGAQIRAALECSRSARVLAGVLRVAAWSLYRSFARAIRSMRK